MNLGRSVSHKEAEDFINFIFECKKKKGVEAYPSIKNAINIFSIPLARTICKKGQFIYRARPNSNSNHFFTSDLELGAPLALNKITNFGRCNEPLQSVFYCSDNYYTACMESSVYARKGIYSNQETITIGEWEILDELTLGIIPSNPAIIGKNKTMDSFHAYYMQSNAAILTQTPQLIEIWDTISKEFATDVNGNNDEYVISCAFANYYLENIVYDSAFERNITLDGIIYPSVQYINEGLNLALRNEVYLSNKLRLNKAIKKTMIKVNKNTVCDDSWQVAKDINQQTGEIIW